MPARIRKLGLALLFLLLTLLTARPAWALRFGALGNSPIGAQAGWPEGTAAVFNPQQRIAYWELNGQWKSECRGDAEAFSKVVANFALIQTEGKKLILHDGVGKSYWVGSTQPNSSRRTSPGGDGSAVIWKVGRVAGRWVVASVTTRGCI